MTVLLVAKLFRACMQSQICFDSTLGLLKALSSMTRYSLSAESSSTKRERSERVRR